MDILRDLGIGVGKYDKNSVIKLSDLENLKHFDLINILALKREEDIVNCMYIYKDKLYIGTNCSITASGHDNYNYIYVSNLDNTVVDTLKNNQGGEILPFKNYDTGGLPLAKIDTKKGFLYVQISAGSYNIAQIDLNDNNNIKCYFQGLQDTYSMRYFEVDEEGYVYICIGTTLYKYDSLRNIIWQKTILTSGEYIRKIIGTKLYTNKGRIIDSVTGDIISTGSAFPLYITKYGVFDIIQTVNSADSKYTDVIVKKVSDTGTILYTKLLTTYLNSEYTSASSAVKYLSQTPSYCIVEDKIYLTLTSSIASSSYYMYSRNLMLFDLVNNCDKIFESQLGNSNQAYFTDFAKNEVIFADTNIIVGDCMYQATPGFIKKIKITNYMVRR